METLEPGAGPRTRRLTECPACRCPADATPLFETADRQHSTPGLFQYSLCPQCRSIYQNPQVIVDDRDACYPADYYTHTRPAIALTPRRLERVRERVRSLVFESHFDRPSAQTWLAGRVLASIPFVRRRAFFGLMDELIPPRKRGARALDIGCGSGKLLRALNQAGWAAEGVDWDPRAAATAMTYAGCPVQAGDFCEIPLPANAYSMVLMNHVFEHLDDPLRALRRIRELLCIDGRAVLIYPNPAALGAEWFKKDWFCWEAPRHLVLVHPLEAAELAVRAGLKVVERRTLARTAAGVSAQSRAYQRGQIMTTEDLVLDRKDRFFQCREWLQMLSSPMTGEEVLLVLGRAE